MKSRALVPLFLAVCIQGTPALAQDFDPGLELTLTPLPAQSVPTCFQLIDPSNSCLIVAPSVVNYTAPAFNRIDLNGGWADEGGQRPFIYIYGDGNPIFVEMSLSSRPDGFGYFVDADTILVLFPDDRDYTGTLINPTTILWSNNTVWHKL